MTKYQELLVAFEKSGKNQKDFAKSIGKSASRVSTMLKRARQERKEAPAFQTINIEHGESKSIRIITSSGTQIEIPI